jgi:hypothetical protein
MRKTNVFEKNLTFMRWILKRRRLIAIAIILCICFLIYQLISLKELNVQMSQSKQRLKPDIEKSSVNNHLMKPIVNYLDNSLNDNQVMDDYKNQIIDQKNIVINDKKDKQIETNEQILSTDKLMIGVMPKFYSLYEKKSDLFRCLLSGEEIPYSYLNDDYCDCSDGSDEPSTNACPFNRFVSFNSFNNKNQINPFIGFHKISFLSINSINKKYD